MFKNDEKAQAYLGRVKWHLWRSRTDRRHWNYFLNWLVSYQQRLQQLVRFGDLSEYRRIVWWNPETKTGGCGAPLETEIAQAWVEWANKEYSKINHYLQAV